MVSDSWKWWYLKWTWYWNIASYGNWIGWIFRNISIWWYVQSWFPGGILQSKFNFHGWLYFDNSQSRLNINGSSSMWFWLNCIICGLGQPACYNLLRSQNDMKGTAEILGDRAAQVKIKIHPGKWWSFRFPGSQTHFIPMKPHVFQWFHGQNRLIHFSIGPGSPKGTVLWWWPGRIGLNSWIMFEAINQYNSNLW